MCRLLMAAVLAAGALAVGVAGQASGAMRAPDYLVALGDSYAVGYQPGVGPTLQGFNDQTVTKARKKGYRFTLVNFGCGGATTESLLTQTGCAARERAVGKLRYTGTQVAAAVRFIKAHRKNVGLVTVSIGGNDVTGCAKSTDPVACVGAVKGSIEKNLRTALKRLRVAGGPKLRIVGITYPDVILGQWVWPPVSQELAKLSLVAFRAIINPALKSTYKAAKASFVDVTAATGAYTPLSRTTTLAPYGVIPIAVAKVCRLTWYCEKGDIHARKSGYGVIAGLIVRTLPQARSGSGA